MKNKLARQYRIACLGDSCVDHYAALRQKHPGGNPVNCAVYVNRLGAAASFIGAVGTDEAGAIVCAALEEKGVDISHVQRLPGKTPSIEVVMEQGNRVFGAYDTGVMEQYRLRQADIAFLCEHDLLVTDIWGRCEDQLPELHKLGLPIAFDCADLPFDPISKKALPSVDIAFFSDDTCDTATLKQIVEEMAAAGPKIVVVMRGAQGSLAFDGESYYHQCAIDCPVVDTLGAGDSYIAGFLLSLLEGHPIPDCMRAGAENAAITIGYYGAW